MSAKTRKIPRSTRFEDALGELETLVKTLETGDTSLDESLAQFERGVALARHCQVSLSEAEQKVRILLENQSTETDPEELPDFDAPDREP